VPGGREPGGTAGTGQALGAGGAEPFPGVNPPALGAAAPQQGGAGQRCSEDSPFQLLQQLLQAVGKWPPNP